MITEEKYDFKKRMLSVHKSGVRDMNLTSENGEYEIKNGFSIILPKDYSDVVLTASKDFQDYLFTSMKVSAMLTENPASKSNCLIIAFDENQNEDYKICFDENITITAKTDRMAAQGVYCLEDMMNTRRAPFIKKDEIKHTFMFSPRMTHSGYGMDDFPDSHLSAIAHAGMDSILVFTKGVNQTKTGYLNFNELIWRASKYGLDVYAYSFIMTGTHPDDEGAQEEYDKLYGELFRQCPGLKGVTLVGEIVGFNSKDERAYYRNVYGPDAELSDLPHPGFFPCRDYPQWLECIKKAVYKYKPDADIVLWSYNWGNRDTEARLELINNLPLDVTLMATFEMYEICPREGIMDVCSDYTLSFAGPGNYFKTEAEAALKRGLKLYAMANTGGQTWDMGTIPYEPMPYQWIRRYYGLRDAHEKWGLSGLMECHHYGFYPSFISDLAKQAFIKEKTVIEDSLKEVLSAKFGTKYVDVIDKALDKWSEAITYYTPTDDDQYGAFRIGPSYPLCLNRVRTPPSQPHAPSGNALVKVVYPAGHQQATPPPTGRGMLASLRVGEEIKSLDKMLTLMKEGRDILDTIPEEECNDELLYLVNLGKYICCYVQTGINAKKWYKIKNKLTTAEEIEFVPKLVEEARALLDEERKNAEEAIVYADRDSRLGWEPTMDYMGDSDSIRWKLKMIDYVYDIELEYFLKASDKSWLSNKMN
ncbi:MAG: hypothetical protein II998_00135 [Clostridia bacterium]|nr:hypothetical protein [Clostridia bacterium]